jgi:hypothetical protein
VLMGPVCLVLVFALAPAWADDKGDPHLSTRLMRVEAAFKAGDANSLRSSCPRNGRVEVDLRGLTTGNASYGPGQFEAIFRHIFDDFETKDFTFAKDDVKVSSEGTAFARGRWVRRRHSGGGEASDFLTFTFREESGEWRIQEIRSSR